MIPRDAQRAADDPSAPDRQILLRALLSVQETQHLTSTCSLHPSQLTWLFRYAVRPQPARPLPLHVAYAAAPASIPIFLTKALPLPHDFPHSAHPHIPEPSSSPFFVLQFATLTPLYLCFFLVGNMILIESCFCIWRRKAESAMNKKK
jgi:hypothetical protein